MSTVNRPPFPTPCTSVSTRRQSPAREQARKDPHRGGGPVNPQGRPVQQSGHAAPITRKGTGQEGPTQGGRAGQPPRPAGSTVRARGANHPHQGGQLGRGYNTTPLRPAGNSPATAAESTRTGQGRGVPFPGFLPVVVSKCREHREQTRKTHVTRCHHWIFLFPEVPGTNPKTPGTPGTNDSGAVRPSAALCWPGLPAVVAGVFAVGRSGGRSPRHIPPKVGEYPAGSVHYGLPRLPTHRAGCQLPAREQARKDPHRGLALGIPARKVAPPPPPIGGPACPAGRRPLARSKPCQAFTAGMNW